MASQSGVLEEHTMQSAVRGHQYTRPFGGLTWGKDWIWREDDNAHQHAVKIVKDGDVVGMFQGSIHVRCGTQIVACQITGSRKLGKGLEEPCEYIFTARRKFVCKLKRLTSAGSTTYSCPYCNWLT